MDAKNFMFSASSFKDYLQCGLKFKFSKIDKAEKTETATHHRWFGSLVHALIYYSIADYEGDSKTMKLRKRVRKKETLNLLESLWNEKAKNSDGEIILKSIGEKPKGKFSRGKIVSLGSNNENIEQSDLEAGWLEEAKKMVSNGIDVISNIHEIVELEKKIFYHIKGYKFMGFVDVLAKNKEGEYEFYDFKTSWDKAYNLEDDFQFFGYTKALSEDKKLEIDEKYFPKGYWVFLRKGDLLPYTLAKEKFWQMIKLTQSAMDNIESNIFLPDYGGSLCKFCDYRHICYGEDEKIWSRGK
jgi:CRISPR/Cas system-associated exonuclease Cas4 (RecB family)